MNAAEKLEPCPFCAHDAVDVGTLDSGGWTAECGNCGSSSGVFNTSDEAVAAWNIRRAAPALRDAIADMVGLTQLLLARSDLPADVRDALANNHRVIAARDASTATA